MVIVFIWLPNVKGDIGHGAMQVNSEYISNWPGALHSIAYGPGQPAENFESDRRSERRMPQITYILKGLNETAMETKWITMKKDLKYSFPTYNCFTTVAEVLHEGLGGWKETAAELAIPHEYIILHVLLIQYCERIKKLYDGQRIVIQ
jgi:hypothetical protein